MTVMHIFLIAVMAILATVKVTIQGVTLRRYADNELAANIFTASMFAAVSLILFFVFRPPTSSLLTMGYSFGFGICSAGFQLSYARSLRSGPVSLTVLIINLSFLISVVYGVLFNRESLSLLQTIGIVLLAFSLVLNLKKSTESKPLNRQWLLFVVIGFFCSGLSTVIQHLHQQTAYADESSAFLILSNFMAFLIVFLHISFTYYHQKTPTAYRIRYLPLIISSLLIGITLGTFQVLQLWLIGTVNVSLLFPLFNGFSNCAVFLSGQFIFRDNLTTRQKIGFFIGVLSIIAMNL